MNDSMESNSSIDPNISTELKVPFLSGQEDRQKLLEQATRDLGVNLQKFRRSNGDRFIGNVVGGKPEGVGVMYYRENDPHGRVAYRGDFVNGQRHGIGIMWWSDGSSYEGQWKENKPEGYGLETYPDGGVYSGQFHDDSRHGLGAYAFADGKFFVGNWEGGVQHGRGLSKTEDSSAEIVTEYEKGEMKRAILANEESKESIHSLQAELSDILQQTETVAEQARTAAERVEVLDTVSTLLPDAVRPWSGKVEEAPKVETPRTLHAADSARDLLMPDAQPELFYSFGRAVSDPSSKPMAPIPKSPHEELENMSTAQLFNSLKNPNATFVSANLGSLNSLKPEFGSVAPPQFSSINLSSKSPESLDASKAKILATAENLETRKLFSSKSSPDMTVTSVRRKSIPSIKPSSKDSPQEDKEGQETAKLFSSLRLSPEIASVKKSLSMKDVNESPTKSMRSMPASPEIKSMKAASVVDSENTEMKNLFDSLHTTDAKLPSDEDGGAFGRAVSASATAVVVDKEIEAAVKIQSGLRGMMERKALKREAEAQHQVEPIAESEWEEEEGDVFEGIEEAVATSRISRSCSSAPNLQLIEEDREIDGEELKEGALLLAQSKKKSLPKERVVVILQALSEDEVDEAGEEGKEDSFSRVKSEVGALDKIEEAEEEGGESTKAAADDLDALVAEGTHMLENLSIENAEAVAAAIGCEVQQSPLARVLVNMVPPMQDTVPPMQEVVPVSQETAPASQDEGVGEEEAAVRIQSGLRGRRDRKAVQARREAEERERKEQEAEAEAEAARRQEEEHKRTEEEQKRKEGEQRRKEEEEAHAAVKIQSGLRGRRDRKAVQERRRAREEVAGLVPDQRLTALVEEGSKLLSDLPMEDAMDIVRTLHAKSHFSPIAKVLYDKLANRQPMTPRSEAMELAVLIEEGTKLLCELPMEDAMDVVRSLHASSTVSPVARALYDRLAKRTPRNDAQDEEADAMELAVLVEEGTKLLGNLPMDDAMDVVRTLHARSPASPVAKVLYHMLAKRETREAAAEEETVAEIEVGAGAAAEEDMQLAEREEDAAAEEESQLAKAEMGAAEDAGDKEEAIKEVDADTEEAKEEVDGATEEEDLAVLVEEGAKLLHSLRLEDAMEVVRTLHAKSPSSPVARALYDKLNETAGVWEESSSSSVPKLQLNLIDSQSELGRSQSALQRLGSVGMRQSLTDRSRQCLEMVIAEGRELMGQMQGLDIDILSVLNDKVGSSPLASVLYYEATSILAREERGKSARRAHRPSTAVSHRSSRPSTAATHSSRPSTAASHSSGVSMDGRILSQRTWHNLEDLISEGETLLERLDLEDAEDILRTIRERAASSPLAALLLDQLLSFRPRGIIRDPSAMCSALSARSQRHLADLLTSGRQLLSSLGQEQNEDIFETLRESARTSPVAAALLYEVLCSPPQQAGVLEASAEGAATSERDRYGQLSTRTRGALESLLREGQELGRRLRDEQTEALLTTIQQWAGTNTLAAAISLDLLTYRPARAQPDAPPDSQTTRRVLSSRSRRRLQELRTEGLQLARQLGSAGNEELVRMLPGITPANPLAAILYSELITSYFSGGGQRVDLTQAEGMRRALTERSRRRLADLMEQGRVLLERLDESPAHDLMQTLLSERESPIACVIRAELLASQVGGASRDESAYLLTARTRKRIEELLGECGKMMLGVDQGSADSLLGVLTEQAGKNPLATVLYNAMLWSLTGRQKEGADGEDGWTAFSELVRGVGEEGREEVSRIVTESAALMEALGQGNAHSVLEVVRGQQGVSPLATVMYNKLLEGLSDLTAENQGVTQRTAASAPGTAKESVGNAEEAAVEAEETDRLVLKEEEGDEADDEREPEEKPAEPETEPGPEPEKAEEPEPAPVEEAPVEEAPAEEEVVEAEDASKQEEAEAEAALKIQSGLRGMMARKEKKAREERAAAALKLQCAMRGMMARREMKALRDQVPVEPEAEPTEEAAQPPVETEAEPAEKAADEEKVSAEVPQPLLDDDAFPDPVPEDPFWFVQNMNSDLKSEVHTYLWRKRMEEGNPFALIAQKLSAREIGPKAACVETELLLLPLRWRNTRATSTTLPYAPSRVVRRRFKASKRAKSVKRAAVYVQQKRKFKSNPSTRQRVAWKWAPKHRVQRESREYDEKDAQTLRRKTTFDAVKEVCLKRASRREVDDEIRKSCGMPFRSIPLIRRIQAERARQNFDEELVLHKRRVKLGCVPSSAYQRDTPEALESALKVSGMTKTRESAEVLQRRARVYFARVKTADAMVRRDLRIAATKRLQNWARNTMRIWNARLDMRARIATKTKEAAEKAATLRLQGAYRGRMARLERRFLARIMDARLEEEQEQHAVLKTQAFFRKMLARKIVSRMKQNKLTRMDANQPKRASLILQCAIRSHWARRHYHAVKDNIFFGFACRVAIRLQAWARMTQAKRQARKVAHSLHMMQQWSAGFAWNKTVTDLTRLAAADWRSLVKNVGALLGPKTAFREAQALAPAVMPSWWLGHFPVSFSSRVNLKAAPLVNLQEQLRKDRILALGGICKFEKSLQFVAELVREVTEVHVEALDLSESYEALVSLLAFCNIQGCELASSGEPSSQQAGHELLLYAGKLADGPNLSVSGMREKLEFRQWTHCNLTRVYYLEGKFDKASYHARILGSMTTGEPRRDALTKVTSMLYLAAVQSKACKHNTAIATLQDASDTLAQWCADSDPAVAPVPSWTTFCCSKDMTRRYHCTPSHLAAVCQYNLSVELASREQYPQAVLAAKRAVALAAIDKIAEPVFHRRAANTLAAMEVIKQQPPTAANRPPPEIIDRLRNLSSPSQDDLDLSIQSVHSVREVTLSRPGTSNSSHLSKDDTIRIYQSSRIQTPASPSTPAKADFEDQPDSPRPMEESDPLPLHMETSRRRFGVWFPPHVALRNTIDLSNQPGDLPEKKSPKHAPPSPGKEQSPPSPLSSSMSSSVASQPQGGPHTAFLRKEVSLVELKGHGPRSQGSKLGPVTVSDKRQVDMGGWHGKRNLLEAQLNAELLLLNMMPLQRLDVLEMITPEGVGLKREVLAEDNPKAALAFVVQALQATNTHSNMGLKPSPSLQANLKDIAVITVLCVSKYMSLGQEGMSLSGGSPGEKEHVQAVMKANTKWAEKFARVAATILFGTTFKGLHGELKALVKMQIALCQALTGQLQAAMYGLLELKTAFAAKKGSKQLLVVLMLNLSTMLSKMDMHKDAFEACDEAWQVLSGMNTSEDWDCFSPGHSVEETVRVPWGMLCGFCKFQQAVQSLWMGFEGPALKLAETSYGLTHKKGHASSLPPDAVLAGATEKVLQCIAEWGQAMATPPLLSRWIASVPPPPEQLVTGPPVRVVKQLGESGRDSPQKDRYSPQKDGQVRYVRRKVL